MTIYTRKGDEGETGLFGGGRISKDDPRIEATGAVDELNAVLGRALCSVEEPRIRARIPILQDDLFSLGSRLASPAGGDEESGPRLPALPSGRPKEMEGWIDEIDEEVEPLKNFILPGGSPAAADLHVARTVCRRAERRVVALAAREEGIEPEILRYLNRLSDLLFAFGRLENRHRGRDDVLWHGPRQRGESNR